MLVLQVKQQVSEIVSVNVAWIGIEELERMLEIRFVHLERAVSEALKLGVLEVFLEMDRIGTAI